MDNGDWDEGEWQENERSEKEEVASGSWRFFEYDDLMKRDKANLDNFWLRDENLKDAANLSEPDILAVEIINDLEAALQQFRSSYDSLEE